MHIEEDWLRDRDVVPVVLSEGQHQDILNTQIIPVFTGGAVAQKQPVKVLVAGPPGSGKSEVADLIHAALGRRGGAVRIGSITERLVSVWITRWSGV
ncbi:zeta toxin family protein [Streptomyces sp. NBC_01465]|uniref:zeta toxin family protein n=1 Tax=Streptomyces sp. NBC_01465 TaxID=2903878 RepID=UPI002E31CF2D|nr:zeta toxin family protein [Streptomyces sp. NBC_01465]